MTSIAPTSAGKRAGNLPHVEADYPVFEIPSALRRSVATALQQGETHYTVVAGVEPVRTEVMAALVTRGIAADSADLLLTAGEQESRFLAIQALRRSGATIAIPAVVHPGAQQAATLLSNPPIRMEVDPQRLTVTAAGVRSAIDAALKEYEKLGAKLVPISLPRTELSIPVYYIIAPAEASSNLSRFDGVKFGHRAKNYTDLADMYQKTRAEGFGDEVKRRIMIGTYVLSHGYYDAYYLQAQKIRRMIADDFQNAFKNCDLIAGPVAPTVAWKIGAHKDPLADYLAGAKEYLDVICDQVLSEAPRHNETPLRTANQVMLALNKVLGTADAAADLERADGICAILFHQQVFHSDHRPGRCPSIRHQVRERLPEIG